ncbi:GNAT family N-acetyltransferase [Pedobacter sp. JY14-1]|uniref:GNAT family N-acetyltransferase n=1 Tax=Pedobacter sp. JY14-1 TaxID=3034151 RepID=UPI0023E253C7|nr:GNAT family N-acetyltransferase [Pedobacter sp. JY14-1]
MSIELRTARREDCPRLLELVRELALYERAPEEVTVTQEEFEAAGFGEKPVWKAFVAEENQTIVGFALFYTRYSTWKGCRLYLEDFLVTESHRGRGIGKLLFERVIREASEGRYNGMNWQVLDWNAPGINFYNKYGAGLDPEWLNASFSKEQLEQLHQQILQET